MDGLADRLLLRVVGIIDLDVMRKTDDWHLAVAEDLIDEAIATHCQAVGLGILKRLVIIQIISGIYCVDDSGEALNRLQYGKIVLNRYLWNRLLRDFPVYVRSKGHVAPSSRICYDGRPD